MNPVVCHIPFVPLRSEPSHRSELVSQLLFGETARIIESKEDWLKVQTDFDNYTGWLELGSVTEPDPEFLTEGKLTLPAPYIRISQEETSMLIPGGAEIPLPDANGNFLFGNRRWCVDKYNEIVNKTPVESLVLTARLFLNAPYLWGGRTVFGIDCSGFTQLVYKIHRKILPRDAKEQVFRGDQVDSLSKAQQGDLLFFSNEKGIVSHTGILCMNNEIIHASKWVRIDKIDERGIYNTLSNKYTHTLNSIRRIVD